MSPRRLVGRTDAAGVDDADAVDDAVELYVRVPPDDDAYIAQSMVSSGEAMPLRLARWQPWACITGASRWRPLAPSCIIGEFVWNAGKPHG
jgi:hypothetical protein